MKMLTIPEARGLLLIVADNLHDRQFNAEKEIRDIVKRMYRTHTKERIAKATAKRVTPEMACDVRSYYESNKSRSCREIGKTFGIDGGRVSECIAGKW